MKRAERTDDGRLQIIFCIEFDRRAALADVSALKLALVDSANCVHSIEVTGSFDLIAEFSAPTIGWYKGWLASTADLLARAAHRYETNFVFGRTVRRALDEKAIWVPEDGGFRRVDAEFIDKVTAEGDYVRIHSQGQSWMLHETMKSVLQRLAAANFIRLHRSTIVRLEFVDRVARERRHWIAHLADGTVEQIAASHVHDALQIFRSRPERSRPSSEPVSQVADSVRV